MLNALQFPCTVFTTQKEMDDYGAADMLYGDLPESQLKMQFHLTDISARVDPYTLTKITPFSQPHSMFHGSHQAGGKVTREECARILFDEFRDLSQPFAIYSPYQYLIKEMINHMQYGNGMPFFSACLDSALEEQILNDVSKNSTLTLLKNTLEYYIDWENGCFPLEQEQELRKTILDGKLPKFDRFQDNFNGMGITVHDTWATHITITSLKIKDDSYRAVVHYRVQDHFGLDSADILKFEFSQFRFFRIWFVLQRYNKFGFKPFMTDMQATIEITGRRRAA